MFKAPVKFRLSKLCGCSYGEKILVTVTGSLDD